MFDLPDIGIPSSKNPDQMVATFRQIAAAIKKLSQAVSTADLTRYGILTKEAAASPTGQSAIAALNETIGGNVAGLSQETTARQQADIALGQRITQEIADREDGDDDVHLALTTAITAEQLARTAADDTLRTANKFKVISRIGTPVVADIAAGTAAIVKDTAGLGVRLYYNDGGTLKSVALS